MQKVLKTGINRQISMAALSFALALAMQGTPEAASAQPDSRQTQSASENRGAFDEIVVTATRRVTRLQDVPASIVAFGSEQLERQRIEETADLFQQIPSGSFVNNTKTTSYVALRGLFTFDDSPGADLPVAFFIDDVYLNGIVSNHINMFDLDRVEVLRGPQGTLFGRNVVGGAIMMFRKRPSFDSEFKAQVGYGNDKTYDFNGVVGGTLAESTLAGRLTFQASHSDGGFYNRTLDETLESKNLFSMTGQLLYTPTDKTDVLLSISGTRDTGRSQNLELVTSGNIALVDSFDRSPSPFINELDISPDYEQEIWTALLRVDSEIGFGTLTSISAYHSNKSSSYRDVDALPIQIVQANEFVNNEQFTQEVRLATPSDKPLSAILGGFYLNATNDRAENQIFDKQPGTLLALLGGGPGFIDSLQDQHFKIESIALFGDLTWRAAERLSLQVGGRWTKDKKSGYQNLSGTPNIINGAPIASGPVSGSWSAFTPRGVIRYKFDDQRSIYGSVSRGFKGGGFAPISGTIAGLTTPYKPEFAWNYEVGLRSTWFDRRLLLNVTGYWMDLTDLQVRTRDANANLVGGNAGKVRAKGIETEMEAYPTNDLRLYANYAYTSAKYIDAMFNSVSAAGNYLPQTPKHAVVTGFTYSLPLENNLVRLNMDLTHKSAIHLNEANDLLQPFRQRTKVDSLINASLSFGPEDRNWDLTLWGKNLTNEGVATIGFEVTPFVATLAERLSGLRAAVMNFNPPRSYGLTFTIRH